MILFSAVLLVVRDTAGSVFGAFLPRGIAPGWQVDATAFIFTFSDAQTRVWSSTSPPGEEPTLMCHLQDDSLRLSIRSFIVTSPYIKSPMNCAEMRLYWR